MATKMVPLDQKYERLSEMAKSQNQTKICTLGPKYCIFGYTGFAHICSQKANVSPKNFLDEMGWWIWMTKKKCNRCKHQVHAKSAKIFDWREDESFMLINRDLLIHMDNTSSLFSMRFNSNPFETFLFIKFLLRALKLSNKQTNNETKAMVLTPMRLISCDTLKLRKSAL